MPYSSRKLESDRVARQLLTRSETSRTTNPRTQGRAAFGILVVDPGIADLGGGHRHDLTVI